ncbi:MULTISPECIES: DUF551 domain-containing protein [Desulfitobacterium]|uniref:DUF551 domain-containing protein n=1 Tax=Desulfitobacterium chlororespirans DSM 11544 TaxID=1121395 RepID=A0A1M7UU42_9FIRM|nr:MULTISPECIES: DUF551 domain-containing protein [Desulfitobacterium]SHN86513.1 Protein of unknown function [Desulfitobacterium chlororespirans DSM 11544]
MKQMMQEAFWISVVDRLPEVDVNILLCDANGNLFTGDYTGEVFEDFYGYECQDITHWMSIPKRPKKEGDMDE